MEDPSSSWGGEGIPDYVLWFGVAFLILFVVVVGFIIFTWVKNWRAFKQAGLDPIAAQSEIAGRLMNSELLAPEQTLEQRLGELDDLHARGVISDEEHRAARAKALSDG